VTGELPRAEETAGSAAARLEALVGKTGSDLRNRLSTVYRTLGYIQARRGEEAASLASLEKASAYGKAYCAEHLQDRNAQANFARVQSELVERLGHLGQHRRAADLAGEARATLERLVAEEPNNAAYRRGLIYALNLGAEEVEAAGDAAAANLARRRSLELADALVATEPGNQGDRIALTYTLHGLGAGLVRSKETEPGLDYLRQAVRSAEVSVKADPASVFAREHVAEIEAELGLALHGLGIRRDEMCSALQHGVALWQELDRAGHLPGEIRSAFDKSRAALSSCGRR